MFLVDGGSVVSVADGGNDGVVARGCSARQELLGCAEAVGLSCDDVASELMCAASKLHPTLTHTTIHV